MASLGERLTEVVTKMRSLHAWLQDVATQVRTDHDKVTAFEQALLTLSDAIDDLREDLKEHLKEAQLRREKQQREDAEEKRQQIARLWKIVGLLAAALMSGAALPELVKMIWKMLSGGG